MSTMPTSDWIRGNVLGLAAIFLALSGTAYATHPGGANTISSGDIIDNVVRSEDIRDGNVTSADLRTGSVVTGKLADGAVSTAKLADAAVTIPKLAFDPATQSELNAHKNSADHDDEYWTLQGNKGTVAGKQFLGTLDDEPLELWVNSARALRLEPASDGTNQSPNVIGGVADNAVTAGAHSATIAGGGRSTPTDPATANRVTDSFGTVGGGAGNQAGDANANPSNDSHATVGGGRNNTASGFLATVGGGGSNVASDTGVTVGGGRGNEASGSDTTVGGGFDNTASDFQATVGGGILNEAIGSAATVPGGSANTAAGTVSFAAGNRANANHDGAFVWADFQGADMASTANNQFIARASGDFFLQSDSALDDQGGFLNTSTGGYLSTGGTWTNASDENLKQGFEAIEPRDVLREVAGLPVRTWAYEAEPGVRHIGPTAQDFRRAFGLGADERHIASIDADGVALAAIKGLARELRAERRRRIELAHRVARLEARPTAIAQASR